MDNTNKKQSLDDIISAAESVQRAMHEARIQQGDLFAELENPQEIKDLFDAPQAHDPQMAYKIFYNVLQKIILQIVPKGEIRDVINLLKNNLLTSTEILKQSEKRGSDSRMQTVDRLKAVADIITDWVSTRPKDYLYLANLLLEKCKEEGISDPDRELSDFLKESNNLE